MQSCEAQNGLVQHSEHGYKQLATFAHHRKVQNSRTL